MSTLEFTSQFNDIQQRLMPTAYRLTNNVDDAKDLIQETAVRAFNNREKFQMGTNFRAWTITIMRNTFINIYRKKRNRATQSQPSDSYHFVNENHAVNNMGDSHLTMSELREILESLSETYRVPFLQYFEGFKYEEIATQMGLPVGTIKSRIHFARKFLKNAITGMYGEQLPYGVA